MAFELEGCTKNILIKASDNLHPFYERILRKEMVI